MNDPFFENKSRCLPLRPKVKLNVGNDKGEFSDGLKEF